MTAWVGREVGGISLARTAKHFGRDISTMARTVTRLEEKMRADKRLTRVAANSVKEVSVV